MKHSSVILFVFIVNLSPLIRASQVSSTEVIGFTIQNKTTGDSNQATCLASQSSLEANINIRNGNFNQITSSSQDSFLQQESKVDEDLRYNWIWEYLDEYSPGSRISKIEESLDERMSNRIYATNIVAPLSADVLKANTGDKEIDRQIEKLAAGKNVDEHKCARHLKIMVSKLEELQHIVANQRAKFKNDTISLNESHIRLASVLESFGHYDSGVLEGRYMILGSYSQCLRSQLILDDERPHVRTSTRYCLAKLKIDNHLDPDLKRRKMKEYEADYALSIGICIPDSCHSISFTAKTRPLFQTLIDSQFRMPSSLYIDNSLEVKSMQCEVDSGSELRRLSWHGRLLVAFLVCWLSLIIYATYRNYKQARGGDLTFKNNEMTTMISNAINHNGQDAQVCRDSSNFECIYDSINLQNSWQTFTWVKPDNTGERINLDCLSFVKVLGCFLVIVGHTFLINFYLKVTGYFSSLSTMDHNPWEGLAVSLTTIVDTFFVLSGILITYSAMKKFSNRQKESSRKSSIRHSLLVFTKQWFSLFLARYLRLVPLFFLVFWFKKSLFIHIGSGPYWDFGLNKELYSGQCLRKVSWLTSFSFTANYVPLKQLCVGQAWSVSNDIFFALTLTPIIVLMTKKPIQAILLSIVISLASSYSMYLDFTNIPESISNFTQDGKLVGMTLLTRFSDAWYIAPHNRLSPFLVGALFGFLIYNYSQSKELKQWPTWLRGTATRLSIAIIMANFFFLSIFNSYRASFFNHYPVHRYLMAFSLTSSRLIFSSANSIIFLRMTTDWKDNLMMRFCSLKIWTVMAKLNYALLLVHLDVIMFKHLTQTYLNEFTFVDCLYEVGSMYSISCLLALIVHIFFEKPINNLINVFILRKIFGNNQTKIVLNGKHLD